MRRVILAIVSTAAGLVLLLSFKTHASSGLASSATITPPVQNAPAPSPTATRSTRSASTARPKSSGAAASAGGTSRTVSGTEEQTIYGPIQVAITVKSGKITAVNVPVYPNGTFRDQQINSFALPQLVQETIAANSAQIDSVSGATYTSQGYLSSLQSAIDQAGL